MYGEIHKILFMKVKHCHNFKLREDLLKLFLETLYLYKLMFREHVFQVTSTCIITRDISSGNPALVDVAFILSEKLDGHTISRRIIKLAKLSRADGGHHWLTSLEIRRVSCGENLITHTRYIIHIPYLSLRNIASSTFDVKTVAAVSKL